LDIILSNMSDRPIYEQIYNQIKNAIISGELKEGDMLPSIRALAKDLRISVITTKRAYDELERDGYIYTVAGKGCYFLSVVIFEIILIYGLVEFYYSSIEAELSRSAQSIIHNYSQYFNNYDLHRDAKVLLESMPGNTVAQVQIIDDKGVLIADSIEPSMEGKKLDNYDVNMALNGKEAAWKGKIPMTGEPVFSVSFPIIRPDSEEVIGIVRVITTLSDVNEILKNHIIILISLGLCIVFLIFLTGLALTNTIIKPVKEITSAAKAMAQGRFDVRVSKRYDDEIGELGDTLNYMAQEVANQQKMKNDFIASISHELRTPLTSIMGWIITINSGDIDSKEELKEGLDIIERESKRLAELVDELLDFSNLMPESLR